MRKVSTKQAAKNREVARIKATKPDICVICGRPCLSSDAMHLLPKSIYPQYYTEPLNIWKAHRNCHCFYDDSKQFRSEMSDIIDIVNGFATKEEIHLYFGV